MDAHLLWGKMIVFVKDIPDQDIETIRPTHWVYSGKAYADLTVNHIYRLISADNLDELSSYIISRFGMALECEADDFYAESIMGEVVGKKYDAGKPRMTLLPWAALNLVAKVMGHGSEKYGDNNWLLVEPKERYEDAMLRHYTAYKSGELIDRESGHSHLAHMATNALFVLARSL